MSSGGKYSRRSRGRSASPDGRRQQQRRISVRSVRRNPPDVRKLGRAIIRMAALEAEAERAAATEHQTQTEAGEQPAGDSHDR